MRAQKTALSHESEETALERLGDVIKRSHAFGNAPHATQCSDTTSCIYSHVRAVKALSPLCGGPTIKPKKTGSATWQDGSNQTTENESFTSRFSAAPLPPRYWCEQQVNMRNSFWLLKCSDTPSISSSSMYVYIHTMTRFNHSFKNRPENPPKIQERTCSNHLSSYFNWIRFVTWKRKEKTTSNKNKVKSKTHHAAYHPHGSSHTYIHTKLHVFFVSLRIDSVNTVLGPLGMGHPYLCYNL